MSTEHNRSRPISLRPASEPSGGGIPRRVALQALLGGAGAGLVLPATAGAQHPMHRHLSSPDVLEQAQQKAAVTAYVPELLDPHQLKTLEVLAEAIVPGSTAAHVAPFLDQLLAVDSAASRQTFLGALGGFDMAAVERHGQPWIGITASEQNALLREASTAAETSAIGAHFQDLKGWIAGAYYSSEPGMSELGWTGNVFHQELPGCTHPGGHQG